VTVTSHSLPSFSSLLSTRRGRERFRQLATSALARGQQAKGTRTHCKSVDLLVLRRCKDADAPVYSVTALPLLHSA
jgi:hypothetical protein